MTVTLEKRQGSYDVIGEKGDKLGFIMGRIYYPTYGSVTLDLMRAILREIERLEIE